MKKFATRENVFIACLEICQSGETPTVEKVRANLGGGSPKFVAQYMKQWKETYSEHLPSQNSTNYPTPPEVADTFNAAYNLLWKKLNQELVNHELDERDKLIEILEKENKEMKSIADKYLAKLEEITAMNAKLVEALIEASKGNIETDKMAVLAMINKAS